MGWVKNKKNTNRVHRCVAFVLLVISNPAEMHLQPAWKEINGLIPSSDLDTSEANLVTLSIRLTQLWHLLQASGSLCDRVILLLFQEASSQSNHKIRWTWFCPVVHSVLLIGGMNDTIQWPDVGVLCAHAPIKAMAISYSFGKRNAPFSTWTFRGHWVWWGV